MKDKDVKIYIEKMISLYGESAQKILTRIKSKAWYQGYINLYGKDNYNDVVQMLQQHIQSRSTSISAPGVEVSGAEDFSENRITAPEAEYINEFKIFQFGRFKDIKQPLLTFLKANFETYRVGHLRIDKFKPNLFLLELHNIELKSVTFVISEDSGKSWREINAPKELIRPHVYTDIIGGDIIALPIEGENQLFIYRSVDLGTTWTKKIATTFPPELRSAYLMYSFFINKDEFYATFWCADARAGYSNHIIHVKDDLVLPVTDFSAKDEKMSSFVTSTTDEVDLIKYFYSPHAFTVRSKNRGTFVYERLLNPLNSLTINYGLLSTSDDLYEALLQSTDDDKTKLIITKINLTDPSLIESNFTLLPISRTCYLNGFIILVNDLFIAVRESFEIDASETEHLFNIYQVAIDDLTKINLIYSRVYLESKKHWLNFYEYPDGFIFMS